MSPSMTIVRSTRANGSSATGNGGAAMVPYEPLVSPPPPANARADFLSLWHRVITRRTDQLQKMDIDSLNTLYLNHRSDHDSPSQRDKWRDILTGFPVGKPTDKNHFIDLFRYILTCNFHYSVDSTKNADERLKGLEILKKIFTNIDVAHAKQLANTEPKEPSSSQQPSEQISAPSITTRETNNAVASTSALAATTTSTDQVSDRKDDREKPSNDDVTAEKVNSLGNYGGRNTNMATSTSSATATNNATDNHTNKNNTDTNSGSNNKISNSATTSNNNSSSSPEIIEIEIDDDDDDDDDDDETVDEEELENKKNNNNTINNKKQASTLSAKAADAPPTTTTNRSVAETRTSEEKRVEAPPAPVVPKRIPRAVKPLSHTPRFSECTINVGVDTGTPIPSCSLQTRSHCQLTFRNGEETPPAIISTTLDGKGLDDMCQRFEKWEPYWKVVHDCSLVIQRDPINGRCYEYGYKTAPIIRHTCTRGEVPLSAIKIPFQVDLLQTTNTLRPTSNSFVYGSNSRGLDGKPIAWGKPHQTRTYTHGQRRLILRALPLKLSDYYKKKKADTHCWPKGTFFQLNGATNQLLQRKQQSHDHNLWKGLCHIHDLTPTTTNPSARYSIDICTRDKDSYMFQVAICDYLSPDYLFDRCLSPPNVVGSIRKLSYQEGLDIAMKYVNKSAVVLDDSDDDENTSSVKETDMGNVTLTFNMKCPMSMTPIETPVRGCNCKHMQCFDLRNFLQTNVAVSGGRWRCAICEDFVAIDDLVHDGFQLKILETYRGQISTIRDKVQFFSNGTYKLMDENKLRYGNKKKRGNNSSNDSNKRMKTDGSKKAPAEIIEL